MSLLQDYKLKGEGLCLSKMEHGYCWSHCLDFYPNFAVF